MKKIVQRTCIGCNLKKEKKELLRLVLNKKGEFFIDSTGKAEGRGTYICKNEECLEKAKKSKRLEKTFGVQFDDNLYNNLRGVVLKDKIEVSNEIVTSKKLGGDING